MKPELKLAQLKKHPYWKIIDKAIDDLENNQDLELTTHRDCVISYLVDKLIEETDNK